MKRLVVGSFLILILFFIGDASSISSYELYDMWDYMCHDNWQTRFMTGSHPMRNKVKDGNQTLLFIKTTSGYPFEVFNLYSSNIYMKYEGTQWPGQPIPGSEPPIIDEYYNKTTYKYNPSFQFRWCPRYVYHGQSFSTNSFKVCWVKGCIPYPSYTNPSMTGKVYYIDNYNFGGDVGRKPCVIIQHRYYIEGLYHHEAYFYVKEYGLVKWSHDAQDSNNNWINFGYTVFNYEAVGSFNEVCPCWPTSECQ